MKQTNVEPQATLTPDQFPRAARYDLQWMLENRMGPNAVWLAEALSHVLNLRSGMRVLDLGCGKAISSIFLAKEFGVQVWATDLWINASHNWQRVQEAGVAQQVFPIHAEAHVLPFAHGFFDAIVSLDAYHYFGTDDLYLSYVVPYLCPGGSIGLIVPGLDQEFSDGVPMALLPYWQRDYCSFHSPRWWRAHWEKTGLVIVDMADMVQDGWKHWLTWQDFCLAQGVTTDRDEAAMLRADAGCHLGFTLMVAHRSQTR
jgi:cyclopropane fatty-acyl-phospholipid synthase-like methyltransferase